MFGLLLHGHIPQIGPSHTVTKQEAAMIIDFDSSSIELRLRFLPTSTSTRLIFSLARFNSIKSRFSPTSRSIHASSTDSSAQLQLYLVLPTNQSINPSTIAPAASDQEILFQDLLPGTLASLYDPSGARCPTWALSQHSSWPGPF